MAGDSKAAIDARAALLSAGVGRALIDAAASRVSNASMVLDLGCGSGDALAALTDNRTGIGVDLSTAAIESAARRFPDRTWVVANADRQLPLFDGSIDFVMSLHGRRNPPEVARVLTPRGVLLIAVPAVDDVIELRELVQGERIERDRGESVLAEHQSLFDLVERTVIRQAVELDRDRLLDLLHGTYRGARHAAADRIAALARMTVTIASDLFLLRLR